MPFDRKGKDKNVSPSGKNFTDAQVRLYYATDGFSKLSDVSKKRKKKKKKK